MERCPEVGQVIATLRANEAILRAAGIVRLTVHGSVARGEATRSSDIDSIAEFDRDKKLSLISRIDIENRLTDILGIKADIADKKMLGPDVLERAQRESVLVF